MFMSMVWLVVVVVLSISAEQKPQLEMMIVSHVTVNIWFQLF